MPAAHLTNRRATRHLVPVGVIWLVLLLSPNGVFSQQQYGPRVTITLRKATGEQYEAESILTIGSMKTAKQGKESLATLLRRNRIQFSGSAASVFYDLNPDISDFENLPSGSEMNLPTVIGGLEIQNALKQGFWMYISVDLPLKTQIVADVDKLLQLKSPFVALDASTFGGTERKNNLTRLFVQGTDYLHDVQILVQEDTQPFTTEALQQYQDDTDLLFSTTQNILQVSCVSDAEANTISLLVKDLATKARGLNRSKSPGNATPDPQATMIVTIVPENNSRTKFVRICYAQVALFGKRNQCSNTLGPHAKWILPVADYLVWAGIDESSPPLMKPRPVPLENQGEQVPVELVLPD
jgi:hypothetical protein